MSFVTIQFLLRFQHSVSHQPLPLRPSSPYPQPNEVILHIAATSSHGVLQPFAAAPAAPTAAHPPFFSYTTSCQTPGPPFQPPTAAASPFTTIRIPLGVTGTEPQPLPLRWFSREDTDLPPTVTYLQPGEHPAEHDQSWMYTVRVCKDTLAAISPGLLKKSKHHHTCTHRHTAQGKNMYTPLRCPFHAFPPCRHKAPFGSSG